MSKISQKKQEKEQKLLDTAFKLFISKGINETTIQDIVDEAGVAKGTFYLYFKDRYDIIEAIIERKTVKLFNDAISASRKNEHHSFSERLLFIIDYIINELTENQQLLKFIYKNLSAGVGTINIKGEYANHLSENAAENVARTIFNMFNQRAKEEGLKLKDPNVTFFMIIELVGSTCYNSILYDSPLPIATFKPYLYEAIKKLLE